MRCKPFINRNTQPVPQVVESNIRLPYIALNMPEGQKNKVAHIDSFRTNFPSDVRGDFILVDLDSMSVIIEVDRVIIADLKKIFEHPAE